MKLDVPIDLDPATGGATWLRVEDGRKVWVNYDHPGVIGVLTYPREDGPGLGIQLLFVGKAAARWEWNDDGRFLGVHWWGPLDEHPPCPCPGCQRARARELFAMAHHAAWHAGTFPLVQFNRAVGRA